MISRIQTVSALHSQPATAKMEFQVSIGPQRMALAPSTNTKKSRKTAGLRYWMNRVLEECDHVSADFSADPVHDLRVALRRCRSMADGLIAIVPDPEWKKMKKAGKSLFQKLGDLRDVQVMMEWVEKLHAGVARVSKDSPSATVQPGDDGSAEPSDHESQDPVAYALFQILSQREGEQKHEAHRVLEEFDRKQWRQWSKSLPQRASRIRPGSAVFKHLALERWTEARELHNRALRNHSQIAMHSLRIGIKRFRYIVENFLPVEHRVWSEDLKAMQDLLGEVHDLDVLWNTAIACKVFPDEEAKKRWHARILEERNARIERYRQKMTGPHSLWPVWRTALPQGKDIQAIATRRMKLWAKVLDPDFSHSERVARLATQLYDGLRAAGLLGSVDGIDARASLFAAALLHDVGKSEGKKGHHKASVRLINDYGTPLGWKPEDMKRAAAAARFHRGALPTKSHTALRDLLPNEQKTTMELAAVLRLANALDAAHDGRIRRLQVEREPDDHVPYKNPSCVVVAAEGYSPRSATARTAAAERYLLETILRRPILIKAMKTPA